MEVNTTGAFRTHSPSSDIQPEKVTYYHTRLPPALTPADRGHLEGGAVVSSTHMEKMWLSGGGGGGLGLLGEADMLLSYHSFSPKDARSCVKRMTDETRRASIPSFQYKAFPECNYF